MIAKATGKATPRHRARRREPPRSPITKGRVMTDEAMKMARGCDEVEVYLGEGIWWKTNRRNLPKHCSLPTRRTIRSGQQFRKDGE